MFSGKSEELIRRIRRAVIAKQSVLVFKPRIDDRYSKTQVSSHGRAMIDAVLVDTAEGLFHEALEHHAKDPKPLCVIGIDEAQFLGPKLPKVCSDLADLGMRIIVSGLDQDFSGKPFEPMPEMLAIADSVTKLDAICVVCGEPATKTYRKSQGEDLVQVGGSDQYEARCRKCHQKP